MEDRILYKDLSYKVVGLAMQVHTELGFGFLEKVYENAMMVLFEENGISAVQQVPILVPFHGKLSVNMWPTSLSKARSFWNSKRWIASPKFTKPKR